MADHADAFGCDGTGELFGVVPWAIVILVVCGAAIAAWIIARGDLVGADARAYWGGVRLWLGGGDPLDPPPPYMPYVYWSWSLPIFTPWAALPWETAWFVYRMVNLLLFGWSVAWAYRQHPVATAILVAIITIPLATTTGGSAPRSIWLPAMTRAWR